MTDVARPESSGLSAAEKYDLDYQVLRHRFVWALSVVVLAAVGVAVLVAIAMSERFFRVDAPILAAPACWTAAVLVYAFGARRFTRLRARVWATLTVVAGLLVTLAWPPALVVHVFDDPNATVEATVASPDGRHTLVAESFYNMIDPSCRVWLRENNGPLSRQALVWERIEAPCPESMAFMGEAELRIDPRGPGSELTTIYDADEMWVANI